MGLLERFLKYVKIDTMSDDKESQTPSTLKQFDLANILVDELKELGLENVYVNKLCTVYAHLPATDPSMDKIGFLAHMDTIPEVSGTNVRPHVLYNYKGGIIELGNSEVLDPEKFPELNRQIGHTLITTSGDTVLGCDDKGGIAVIMTMLEELIKENAKHGDIYVAFTPDEEIGTGILTFDVKAFPVEYAYTVDGGAFNELSYECFNAAHASVDFKGFEIHPGSAKGMMINASKLAMEFNSLLPSNEAPEYTDGYDGFNHLTEISGEVGHAHLSYILRNHSREILERQKKDFENAKNFINAKYGDDTCTLLIQDNYHNMKEIIEHEPKCIDKALQAFKNLGFTPDVSPIRGGTDGARLTFMGIPCPNLGTGGYNCHGVHEYASLNEMENAVKIVKEIATIK